jgi:hypothetical protein
LNILTKTESLRYHEDIIFRNKINSENKKISLNLSNNKGTLGSLFETVPYCNNKILDINYLESTNVHTLNLSCNYYILNLKNIKSVHKLDLGYCFNIKDISMLHNIRELNITGCDKIKNIGSLRKLKKIKLWKEMEGIHLCNSLEELTVIDCSEKMKRRIRKLKKINPNVKIKMLL